MKIVLFQPDIPQNTGTLLRLCACMEVQLHIIEPCGFVLDDKKLQRSAMDYADMVSLTRHASWDAFLEFRKGTGGKLVLLTTKTENSYLACQYGADDWLLLGRESAGVPDYVHDIVDQSITIPMQGGARSLNVAMAASMVLGEALRQTRGV